MSLRTLPMRVSMMPLSISTPESPLPNPISCAMISIPALVPSIVVSLLSVELCTGCGAGSVLLLLRIRRMKSG